MDLCKAGPKIGSASVSAPVIVVDALTAEGILSMDFLWHHQCNISIPDNSLTLSQLRITVPQERPKNIQSRSSTPSIFLQSVKWKPWQHWRQPLINIDYSFWKGNHQSSLYLLPEQSWSLQDPYFLFIY